MNADDSPVAGQVEVRPARYLVTVWPDGHDCPNPQTPGQGR